MEGSIFYIGDFDFANENVQSHLVKNNARIFNALGYRVVFIGINRQITDINHLKRSNTGKNMYIELPNTLNMAGIFKWKKIYGAIETELCRAFQEKTIKYVITYQCPTYAFAIKRIGEWCKRQNIPYIVNCADIPIFNSQPFSKRMVMRYNWDKLHCCNKEYSNGIIAVSRYIESFYKKNNCASVIVPPLCADTTVSIDERMRDEPVTFIYAGTPFTKTGKPVKTSGMKDRLDLIIDLFLALRDEHSLFRFQILGISEDEYLTGVPRHKEALSKANDICFYGRLSHDEAITLLALADYSINYRDDTKMSRAGFSTKIVESVSLGVSVVSNKTGDIEDYLTLGTEWVLLTDDFQGNLEVLKELCKLSPDERLKNKKALWSKDIFAPERYIDRLRAFFREVDDCFAKQHLGV